LEKGRERKEKKEVGVRMGEQWGDKKTTCTGGDRGESLTGNMKRRVVGRGGEKSDSGPGRWETMSQGLRTRGGEKKPSNH